jgi:hypothetical protein
MIQPLSYLNLINEVRVRTFVVCLDLVHSQRLPENFVMKRITPFGSLSLAVCATLLMPWSASAQPAETPKTTMLILSPASAPVPSLKYRLLPSSAELLPGDAAPIYLRAHGYEDSSLDEFWRQIREKSARWQALTLEDFPTVEVRDFVNRWSGKLKQIEFGTRRKTCDWNYTLPEQRLESVDILLPDAQSMTQWGRILALKARVEIAEKKYDQAIHTIETGLAFGRHLAEGPFLINGLIGIAMSHLVLEKVEELISQPGAPNLYWALTTLPRPLIDLRNHLEVEQKLVENLIPELTETELARPRTDTEWASLLSRMHERIVKWSRIYAENTKADSPLSILARWDLARFKAETLPAARESLKTSRIQTEPRLAAMSDDQVVVLYVAGEYRSLWDDLFKAGYLPPREALSQLSVPEVRLTAAHKPGPLALFASIHPTLRPALMAELRQDRHVAILRVIESLRLYAAAHDSRLPESLSEITEVPVPDDPATGKPFEYRLNGNSADLSGPQAGLARPGPSYRITMRH